MHAWIAETGLQGRMQLSLGEYNFGGEGDVSGALMSAWASTCTRATGPSPHPQRVEKFLVMCMNAGNRKTHVLPLPVLAMAITSWPAKTFVL